MLEALPRILAHHRRRRRQRRRAVVQEARRQRADGGARHRHRRRTRAHGLVGDRIAASSRSSSTRSSCRVGRAPLLGGIGLEGVGRRPSTTAASSSSTSSCARASPGVFAAGDVVDTPQLAHVGFAEAIVDREDDPRRARHADRLRQGPVGHLLASPRSRGAGSPRSRHASRVTTSWSSTHRFAGDARAMIIGETDGLVKLVTDADGLVLGVHIVGPVGHRAARRGLPLRSTGRRTPPTSPRWCTRTRR